MNGSKGVKLCVPEIHGWCSCIKLYDSIDLKWTKGQKLVRYYLIIHILSLSTFILSQITVQSNSKIPKSAQTTSTFDVYRPNWPLWSFWINVFDVNGPSFRLKIVFWQDLRTQRFTWRPSTFEISSFLPFMIFLFKNKYIPYQVKCIWDKWFIYNI